MQWMEYTIKTTSEASEVIAERLAQMGAAGIATEDPDEMSWLLQHDDDTAHIDPSFAEDLAPYTRIRCYFASFPEGVACQDDIEPGVFSDIDTESAYSNGRFPKSRVSRELFLERLKKELVFIGQYLPIEPGEVTEAEVDELSWRDKWKQFYSPLHLSKRVFVCPSWETFHVPGNAKVISLDPGSAFGTGSHETTKLCAEAIDEFMRPQSGVLDLGTGSGILAIAAAKLGARQVRAIDISEHAVEVCRENVAKNNCTDKITCAAGELRDDKGRYDMITANLLADILIDLAPEFKLHLKPLGLLVCSGIVNSKRDRVFNAFIDNGYKLFFEEERNEWVLLIFSL